MNNGYELRILVNGAYETGICDIPEDEIDCTIKECIAEHRNKGYYVTSYTQGEVSLKDKFGNNMIIDIIER